ncbi:serine/threonine-protein kinase Nek2 isoform X1 [Lethenteron reissneri]|uniref:serine/threonine-protein kinase Nek2 isoform X1 n=1 Tax=Lethenteron reissneri TaxID=7753 RepID=UPI002AB5E093|nr:serine/threonine-protein kinase Nek2 isoform X1 [Lethenteron reissneri]
MPSQLDEYEVMYTIGTGSYGECQKIRRKSDGKVLVWKVLDYGTMSEPEKQMLVSEVNLLRELKHPNIVRYFDRIIDRSNTTLYIVMEYCECGDLASLISRCRRDRRFLEEEFVLRVLAQLVLALRECHRRTAGGRTVLHRDLKPANVFLDARHNVKLGDFGLARILQHDTSFAKTFVGTPYYMSPEQFSRMSYNEKSDIWSLGCLLYELCALVPPFTAMNQKQLAEKIKEGKFRRIPYRYSDELNEIISKMLNLKDYLRPSIEQIMQYGLLAEVLEEEQARVAPEKPRGVPTTERRSGGSPSAEEGLVADLRRKEEQLQAKEQALREREERLEQREKELCLRERLADEKLSRMEELALKLDAPGCCVPAPGSALAELVNPADGEFSLARKKVQFVGDGAQSKENTGPMVGATATVAAAVATVVSLAGPCRAPVGRGDALRERLQAANLRTRELRYLEAESQLKSRQLLGMR